MLTSFKKINTGFVYLFAINSYILVILMYNIFNL